MTTAERARGCLLGLAVGDAVGTTVEFRPRGSFGPVTDMVGGGPFNLPAGAWTDDTSMALCLGASLLECGTFDAADQMRRYVDWCENGYMSSTGRCFDIGITTRAALARFQHDGNPFAGSTDKWSGGNGCVMRLAPVPIAYHRNADEAARWAGESSRTTHGAAECVEASQLMARMLVAALNGGSKDDVLFGHDPASYREAKVRAIAAGEYRAKPIDQVRGSGYVIDCLEASAWCFFHATNYREAVLSAVNLGDDADTTGAVCGQLAGAFWGDGGIPPEWLAKLVMRDEIAAMANSLSA